VNEHSASNMKINPPPFHSQCPHPFPRGTGGTGGKPQRRIEWSACQLPRSFRLMLTRLGYRPIWKLSSLGMDPVSLCSGLSSWKMIGFTCRNISNSIDGTARKHPWQGMTGRTVQIARSHKAEEERVDMSKEYELPHITNRSHLVILLHVRLTGRRPAPVNSLPAQRQAHDNPHENLSNIAKQQPICTMAPCFLLQIPAPKLLAGRASFCRPQGGFLCRQGFPHDQNSRQPGSAAPLHRANILTQWRCVFPMRTAGMA
jgi:hypothetical protein